MDVQMRKDYAKVIAKAWADADFKNRLMQDPAAVLKENGIFVSEEMASSFTVPNAPIDLINEASYEMAVIACM